MTQLATISRAVLIVPIGLGSSIVAIALFVPRQDSSLALELFFRTVFAIFGLFWIALGTLGWRNGKGGLVASQEGLTWCDNMFSLFPRTILLKWESLQSAELVAALDPSDLNEQGLLLFLRPFVANPRPLAIDPKWLPRAIQDVIGTRDASRAVILANGEWNWNPVEVHEFICRRIEAVPSAEGASRSANK